MRLAAIVCVALSAAACSGCIVAPVGPYGAPAGVAYVGPTFAIPGPGYLWGYHAGFGWGWHHPQYGWYQRH